VATKKKRGATVIIPIDEYEDLLRRASQGDARLAVINGQSDRILSLTREVNALRDRMDEAKQRFLDAFGDS
jgi:hypothetical protein